MATPSARLADDASAGFAWDRILAAGRRRIFWWLHQLRWGTRFAAFGRRSLLERPDLLTQTKAISIGHGVEIRRGARLEVVSDTESDAPRLRIGDGTSIHFYFHCGAAERVEIGENVLIAGRVYVTDHDHDPGSPGRPPVSNHGLIAQPTIIGPDCWLGEGAMILKGVELGRGCIVAAGSIVTRSFGPYTMVAGIPARALKRWDETAGDWLRVSAQPD